MFGSFGSTPSTFGGGAFSNTAQNSSSMFGQQAQQQPAASSSLFGGGFNQPKATFGTSFGAPQNQSSMFGQQNRLPVPGTGGIFNTQPATANVSPFSTGAATAQVAGTSVPFSAITGNDTMMKNGVASPISTRHQCITCMKEYENKSLEELRMEDYQLNRKGPSQGAGLFGNTQQQQAPGLFSGMSSTPAAAPFGQTSAFGAAAPTGGLFSNINQPKPTTSFFSNPSTSTPAFGAPTSGFSFSNSTSQPTTSLFGANNNTASSSGGLGTTNSFSFGQPQAQQQPTTGLFGAKSLNTTTSSGFGGFGATAATNSTTANKPLGFGFNSGAATSFGATSTSAFGPGTGSLFNTQAQQNKPFSFASPFPNQTTLPTQSAFGTTGGPSFTFTSSNSAAPSLNFGTGSTTSMGGMGGGITSSTFGSAPLNFNSGTSQLGTGFSGFGLNTNAASGFSSFNSSQGFPQPVMQQPSAPTNGPVAFATTPYKDSPLFYNLISNRNLEEMIKPTSPSAQRAIKEASRRRTSTSVNMMSSFPNKNLTFPMTKTGSFNKTIFDGFEEDDKGISIDILSPKTSVKKLTLKNFRGNSIPSHRHSISFSPSLRLRQSAAGDTFNDSTSSDLNNSHINVETSNGDKSGKPYANQQNKSSDEFQSSQPDSESAHQRHNQKRYSDADHPVMMNGGGKTYEGCRVISTRGGYYIHPTVEELDKMVDDAGNCFVNGFIIGRKNHGEIRFLDVVNVAGINLDEIVHFRHKEVVVYPDDTKKPPLGQGLNIPAELKMERVWPIDRITKDPIKSPVKLQSMGYEETLHRSCQRMDAEFVSYNPDTGTWCIKVKHFSKYSCEPEESEDGPLEGATSAQAVKGLGGVPARVDFPSSYPQRLGIDVSTKSVEDKVDSMKKPADAANPELVPTFDTRRLYRHSLAGVRVAASEGADFAGGDVEHNPLSPSDSDDSDFDWPMTMTSPGRQVVEFESVLKDKVESDAVRMMKSVMSMDFEDGDTGDFQPPTKKSRHPMLRKSEMINWSEGIEKRAVVVHKPVRTQTSLPLGSKFPAILNQQLQFRNTDNYCISKISRPQNQLKVAPLKYANYLTKVGKRKEVECEISGDSEDAFESISAINESTGCKMKTAPRVSFCPKGFFITVSNSFSSGSKGKILLQQIEKILPSPYSSNRKLFIETLDQQMKLELEGDKRKGLVFEQTIVLNEIKGSTSDQSGDDGRKRLIEELMMWELCGILWPVEETNELILRDKGFLIKQRKQLSEWLKRYSSNLFGKLFAAADNTPLGLMKKGCQNEANEAAVQMDDYILALCMAQSPKAKVSQTNCQHQLAIWEEEGALEFMDDDLIKMYHLFCGQFIMDSVDVANISTSEWLQHFALYVWYCCPVHLPVDQIVMSFQSCLKQQLYLPQADVSFPVKCDSSIANLCVQLLKAYSFPGYPMKYILDPHTNTVDLLDYKVSWLLMITLHKFGHICHPELFESVTMSFSRQLEQLGLYHWSTFVLNYLPKTLVRDAFIQQLLERNIGFWGSEECESFLAEKLCVPAATIFKAKILQATSQKRMDRVVWYLLRSRDYHGAFREFLKILSIDYIISPGNMASLLHILECLQPYSKVLEGWNSHGSFLLSYLKLNVAKNACIESGATKDKAPEVPAMDSSEIETYISTFVSSFLQFKPKTQDECAFLLELVLSAQKIVEVLLDSHTELMDRDKTENKISSLIQLPIPSEYMDELRYFLTGWLVAQNLIQTVQINFL